MTTGITLGNAAAIYVVVVSITPAAALTIDTVEEDFTVTGVKVGDAVTVSPPGITTGASIVNARVKAADTVAIQFTNPTAGTVTPLAGEHIFTIFRPDNGVGTGTVSDQEVT